MMYHTSFLNFLALKKSQKEANILVQRSCRDKAIDIHGEGKPDILELQSSLMGQWRSLFLHMEDILGRESSQLVSVTISPSYLHAYFYLSYKFNLDLYNPYTIQRYSLF